MDPHRSLRASILFALGAAGCSSSSTASTGSGEPAVVAIATPTATASAEPEPPPDPEPDADRGRPVSKGIGWITEKDGSVHRGSRTTCDTAIQKTTCAGTENHLSCRADADCKSGPNGRCTSGIGQVGTYCSCTYACEKDEDCGADEVCVCRGTGTLSAPHSVCAKAACKVDADCPESSCGLSVFNNGCHEQVSLACRTKADACHTDAECHGRAGARGGGACVVRGVGTRDAASLQWECGYRSCVIGRPLVVGGEARAAGTASREDWRTSADIDIESLSPDLRAALAEHHAAAAAMEHASVASFARFSLQLLALGAPAELVAEAHRAALDEVEHARLGYGIASRFAGRALGPSILPEATAPLAADMVGVVEALVEEGCVGETLGAAEGMELERRAADRGLAEALARIAEDEERHAQLAWRSLKWLLEVGGEEARCAARRAFARAVSQYGRDPEDGPVVREDLGVLSARTLGRLRREVLAEVVEPCRAALGLAS
ncbi:ferritin-like domain-containing protein [Polyangium aurulentum]|uniref:ferritin-like domain-containing protein n=1 Tax=Polyangium aurulentum TaxID=2567896 RepID=UPI0010ADBC7C|nr:ferritin-like domain-containing protein [Polyangium aurulentum]UQA59779.1 ferritin-like domain-containing protein [Polyangium aurulentum]